MSNKFDALAIDGLHNAHYHGIKDWIGSTQLKTLANYAPAKFKHDSEHPIHRDYFDLGHVAHSLILESTFGNLAEIKADNWMTKAAKQARDDARANGLVPLLSKDVRRITAMRDAVMTNDDAERLLTGHVAERSYFLNRNGRQTKCRPDLFHPFQNVIGDLKTVTSADPEEFRRTAYNLGYHQSAAHYQDTVQGVTGFKPRFVFLLVEKEPPFLTSVVELDDEFLMWGRIENERAMRIYLECKANDHWPGYPTTTGLSAPAYAVREMENRNNV